MDEKEQAAEQARIQEVDAAIERTIFGRSVYQFRQTPYLLMSDHGDGCGAVYKIPAYSTDIAAAWLVVEKICPGGRLTGKRTMVTLTCSYPFGKEPGDLVAGVTVPSWTAYLEMPGPIEGRKSFSGRGSSPPEAICRAALRIAEARHA